MTTRAKSSRCYAHDYRTQYSATQASKLAMRVSFAFISLFPFFFLSIIFVPLRTSIILG